MRAAAAAAAALPWLAVLRGGFVSWDDPAMVWGNPLLSLPWSAALPAVFLSFHMTSWQPLGWLLYKALLAAGGGAAFPFHAASLLLHALNAVLLYAVLEAVRPRARPGARLAAVLAWAWHPVHAESVAWVSQLSDLLCGSFVLASLLAHARGRTRAAWGLALLAGACRWKALAAPVFALALDLHERRPLRELPRRHAGYWLAALAVVALNAAAKASVGYRGAWRLPEALAGFYLQSKKLVLPVGLAPADLLEGGGAPWAAGLLLAAALAALAWRRAPVRYAASAFALLLLPTLLFASSGPVAVMDHHLYLASLALTPFLAGLDLRGALPALLLLPLAAGSALQSRVWRDSEALWGRVIAVRPLFPAARLNLAAARGDEGRYPEALLAVEEQLALFPQDPLAWRLRAALFERAKGAGVGAPRLESDAAAWLFERGRAAEASERLERALASAPRDPDLLVNAAIVDGALGWRERARKRLGAALRLAPGHARAAGALRRLDRAEKP